MSKSQQSFNKKEKEKKKKQKAEEKKRRKEERKNNSTGGDLENMIAYVDQFGNILDSPPEEVEEDEEMEIQISTPKSEKSDDGLTGRLVFFNDEKGYGFIESINRRNKYFVHMSDFEDDIKENDLVKFESEKNDRGEKAINVKKAL